jgi:hypothetical protein
VRRIRSADSRRRERYVIFYLKLANHDLTRIFEPRMRRQPTGWCLANSYL